MDDTSELKVNSSVVAPVPSCPFLDCGGGITPPGLSVGGATTSLCSFFSLFVFWFAGLIDGLAFMLLDIFDALSRNGPRSGKGFGTVSVPSTEHG